MTTTIIDKINNRVIVKDHEKDQLTITGDFSSSSITSYWVVNQLYLHEPICVFITRDSALDFCLSYNKKHKTDTFIVINRTIFV